ncbi:MAG: S1C family serine protease [Pseudomonadota bacterium]|jgi:S1-C subfamily serine protease
MAFDPETRRSLFPAALLVALLLLGAGFLGDPSPGRSAPPQPRPVTPREAFSAEEAATIRLFETARNSVTFITTRQRVRDFWTRNVFSVPRGTGSGFIWDEAGHVVTNYHVISGAAEAWVRLADGSDHRAALVGASPAHDLAVLRIDLDRRPPAALPIGTSADLRVGQKVFAIGNPFGLDWTLTTGVVSALDRSLPGQGDSLVQHLIQTDAAINPGNSGGPLLDSAGRLIGINTAIYSPSGANAGIGFAVPVDTLNRVVPQLIAFGSYQRPTLGIEVDEDWNRRLQLAFGERGVVVLSVQPGSAADRAGLRGVTVRPDGSIVPGDIIVAIAGQPVTSVTELVRRLDDLEIGERVTLTLIRDGARVELPVTLQAGSS